MTIEAIHMDVEVHGLNVQRRANLDQLVSAVTAAILNTKRGFQVGDRDVHPGDVTCTLKRVEGEFSDSAENDGLKDIEHVSYPKGEQTPESTPEPVESHQP